MRGLLGMAGLCIVALTLLGCSHDDPVLVQRSTATTTSGPDVSNVVAKLTDPALSDQPLGQDLGTKYVRIQMLSIGLTATEADCVAAAAAKAGGSSVADRSLGQASGGDDALDPTLLLPCVGADRLAAIAGGTPDYGRVPAADVRDLLTQLGVQQMSSAGLSADEAQCVVSKTVGAVPDSQLSGLLGAGAKQSTANDQHVDDAVRTCLTPARLAELGG